MKLDNELRPIYRISVKRLNDDDTKALYFEEHRDDTYSTLRYVLRNCQHFYPEEDYNLYRIHVEKIFTIKSN